MTHPLTIHSARKDMRELILAAAGDEFNATTAAGLDAPADHGGHGVAVLSLREVEVPNSKLQT